MLLVVDIQQWLEADDHGHVSQTHGACKDESSGSPVADDAVDAGQLLVDQQVGGQILVMLVDGPCWNLNKEINNCSKYRSVCKDQVQSKV